MQFHIHYLKVKEERKHLLIWKNKKNKKNTNEALNKTTCI